MHPLWNNKRGLLLYLIAWVVLGVLFSWLSAVQGGVGWLEANTALVIPTVLYGIVCLSSWYLCQAFPLDRDVEPRTLLVLLLASLVTSGIWVLLCFGWLALLGGGGILSTRAVGWFPGQAPQVFAAGNILFLLAATVHYLLIASQKAGEAAVQSLELSLLARDAQLRALRAQVDPHFLFNSLNSISALTTADPAAARTMVLKLAGFIRAGLQEGNHQEVTLDQEFRLAGDYLDIERVRFGERLRSEVTSHPDALRCLVPPLIVQPLIENAVKHGIAHLLEGGAIRISAERRNGVLLICVENPVGPDVRPGKEGTGLRIVRQRLMLLYGSDSVVRVADQQGTFSVTVSFPAREAL